MEVHPHSGKAHIIGVIRSSGFGKSTLIDVLITQFCNPGKRSDDHL
ncbi:MAG: hypothetical protein GY729_14685 [Desulfobacteraceae bacterium]|nr:hypothetical protein [Desulfobacteraceae bacterium]